MANITPISNLFINRSNNNTIGFFGRTSSAKIRNVQLENVNVNLNYFFRVGGLVGDQDGGSITNSSVTGRVNGANHVGGLAGRQQNGGSITNSYSMVNVVGSRNSGTGGLVGIQNNGSSIINSYATGNVISSTTVGGLVGSQTNSSITNSYAMGNISSIGGGSGSYVGGLVGSQRSGGSITNSYSTGSVSIRGSFIGGLVGLQENSNISNCFWDNVSSIQMMGVGSSVSSSTDRLIVYQPLKCKAILAL